MLVCVYMLQDLRKESLEKEGWCSKGGGEVPKKKNEREGEGYKQENKRGDKENYTPYRTC